MCNPFLNSKPEITLMENNRHIYVADNPIINITGNTTDFVNIQDVQWRMQIDGAEENDNWQSCTPVDGNFDSRDEDFSCSITNLVDWSLQTVEIRATNIAELSTAPADYGLARIQATFLGKLLSWWNFDNTWDIGDTIGNFPTANPTDHLTASVGADGIPADYFDGTVKYNVPDPDGLATFDGEDKQFTIKVRLKPSSSGLGSEQYVIAKGGEAPNLDPPAWRIVIDSNMRAYGEVFWGTHLGNDYSERVGGQAETTLTPDEWNEITLVWNWTSEDIGIKVNTNGTVHKHYWTADTIAPSTQPITIAGRPDNDNEMFIGSIDTVRIFTEAEIGTNAPIIILNDGSHTTHKTVFTITGSADASQIDWGPVVSGVQYSINDGANWSNCDPTDGTYDSAIEGFTCRVSGITGGNDYHIKFRSIDTSDPQNITKPADYKNYDLTLLSGDNSPIITLDSGEHVTTNNSFIISGSADASQIEDGPVVSGVQFSLNAGGDWTNCSATDGTYNTAIEAFSCNLTGLASGTTYHVKLRSIDTSDPQNITEAQYYHNYDLTTVTEGINLEKTAAVATSDTVTINGTAVNSNNIGDVQWYQNDQDGWTSCMPDEQQAPSQLVNFSCVVTGINSSSYFVVYIRDIDGNGNPIAESDYGKVRIQADFSNKLVAWWNLTGGSNVVDALGNLNSVTTTGSVATNTTADYMPVAEFNGDSNHYAIADPTDVTGFPGADQSFTIKMRLWPSSSGTGINQVILEKGPIGERYRLSIDENMRLRGTVYLQGEEVSTPDYYGYKSVPADFTNAQLIPDQWNDIEMKWNYEDRGLAIRVNQNREVAVYYSNRRAFPFSDNAFVIGSAFNGDGRILGKIDGVRIFSGADVEAPQITVESSDNQERVTTPTPSFNLTATDTSGVASLEYLFYNSSAGQNLDGKAWVQVTNPTTGNWGDHTITATITANNLTDGKWYLYMRATDVNGLKTVYTNDGWFTSYDQSTATSVMPYYRFVVEVRDTTPPRIYAQPVIPNPTEDKNPAIRGYVKDYVTLNTGDTASNIQSIKYRVNGGEYINVEPLDGAFDSPEEEFFIHLTNLTAGTYSVEIQAADASGNTTESKVAGSTYGSYTDTFTVVDRLVTLPEQQITKEETFQDHTLHDILFTTGIWGNGLLRLRQKIDFTDITALYTNADDFANRYGDTTVGVYPTADGNNLWLATNDGRIMYYNTTSGAYTKYPNFKPGGWGAPKINAIKEFKYTTGGVEKTYVVITYNWDSTIVYDTNNTPENLSDDPPFVDYKNAPGIDTQAFMERFVTFGIDTRANTLAYYAMIADTGSDKFIVRIDTHNTPMDLSDDTYTLWGRSDGLTLLNPNSTPHSFDLTSAYFDQENNLMLIGSYDDGLYVCRDNGDDPTAIPDNPCYLSQTSDAAKWTFSFIKDPNGWYWFGGDSGLSRIFLGDLANRTDDQFVHVLAPADIGLEQAGPVSWIPGVDPVGDEVWTLTRQGHIRGLEYNYTYADTLDDTTYDFKVPGIDSRIGGTISMYVQNRNTAWVVVAGRGLQKISLARSFEDTNVIELLPTPLEGMLAIDQIKLDDVIGRVSAGSSKTLNQLVTYQVSNDAGVSWYQIELGQTLKFPHSDYKLKIRIIFTKGSTPIITKIGLVYNAEAGNPDTPRDPGTPGVIIVPVDNGGGSDGGNVGTCEDTQPSGTPLIYKVEPGTNSLTIYFNPNNQPMDKYGVDIGKRSEEYSTYIKFSDYSDGKFKITGLDPNTKYYMRLRAINGCENGDWSGEVLGMTNTTGGGTGNGVNPLPTPLPVTTPAPTDNGDNGQPVPTPTPIVRPTVPGNHNPTPTPDNTVTQNSSTDKGKTITEVLGGMTEPLKTIVKSGAAKPISLDLTAFAVTTSMSVYLLDLLAVMQTGKAFNFGLLTLGFWKKKKNPWGVVYDAKNKQPLDPVIVTLTGMDGKKYQCITDMYGRYEFIVNPGQYYIEASKTDYAYPSNMVRTQLEETAYEDVLATSTITVRKDEAVRYNIPMDPLKKNWNQLEKVRLGIKGPHKLWKPITRLSFYFGLVWSIFAVVVTPSTFNLVILGIFSVYTIYVLFIERHERWGVITDQYDNPSAGLLVTLVNPAHPNLSGKQAVTDVWGRYNFLVSKGSHKIKIEKIVDGVKTLLYESRIIEVEGDFGRIAQDVCVRV